MYLQRAALSPTASCHPNDKPADEKEEGAIQKEPRSKKDSDKCKKVADGIYVVEKVVRHAGSGPYL